MKTQKKLSAIGIGEILWDLFPEGKELGGAPTNFAFHINQMNIHSTIISAVGKDPLGEEIKEMIRNMNLDGLIQTNEKPTGMVSVTLDEKGIPQYIIHEDVAWDYVEITDKARNHASEVDAICFGSLAQRSNVTRNTIQTILRLVPKQSLKVFDINIRQHYYNRNLIASSLELANILKINDEELLLLSEMLNIDGEESEIINILLDIYKLDYLALTKGSVGSWLISPDNASFIETPDVNVKDTVGAGDSFTAAMVAGLLHGLSFVDVHQLAVDVSAFVCTQEGATPPLPENLVSRLGR
jgi:fructokinase